MQPTPYPYINTLLADVLAHMHMILGARLMGLYLYGSLVTGDFDDNASDIDLLAAVASDITTSEFDALNHMHHALIVTYPHWVDRLEIAYLALDALKTFKQKTSQIAIISPGEPFNIKDAGKDWLVNWYMVREKGVVLYGVPPTSIIDAISQEEFLQCIKNHARSWREWMQDAHTRPAQAYAILTMCRSLYTCKHGEQISKLQAARWAQQQLPQWSNLIQQALLWRQAWREEVPNPEATLPATQQFVYFVIDRIFNP